MKKPHKHKQPPIIAEKDEDGMFVVEYTALEGCYSQGKTLDEALKNIHEAIELALEEEKNQKLYEDYAPQELSFHLMSIEMSRLPQVSGREAIKAFEKLG